jgi:hypothetical protein
MYGIARSVLKDKPNPLQMPDSPSEAQQQKAIESALELAYAERPARDQVVNAAKQALVDATAFVRSKDLVTVPNDPVKVILMPEFQRGVAVAYCDSPGPLDKGLDTYFAISPIPDDWTKAQTDSFLREYNSRMIQLLTIHEAMPGHYLEGAHSAQFPSTLRAVLRSGLFAEGWAVYTERMMTDAGYDNGDPLFKLVQRKFYLRTIANAILDQGVHVDGMSREQAMRLMTHAIADLLCRRPGAVRPAPCDGGETRRQVRPQGLSRPGVVLRRAAGALRARTDAGPTHPVGCSSHG